MNRFLLIHQCRSFAPWLKLSQWTMAVLILVGAAPAQSRNTYGMSHRPYSAETQQRYQEFLRNFQLSLGAYQEHRLTQKSVLQSSSSNLNEQFEVNQCRRFYEGLYARSGLLIRTVYGYYDAILNENGKMGITVGDRIEVDLLTEQLQAPCPQGSQGACGFTLLSDGQKRLLEKAVVGPLLTQHQVRVELIHSSATDEDQVNRDPARPNEPSEQQRIASQFARQNFLAGFREADVLIYLGHARAGAGPDFLPPILRKGTRRDPVNYSAYTKERRAFREMLSALNNSPKPPRVFALFACKSAPLFASSRDELARRMRSELLKKDIAFVGSTRLTDSNTDLAQYIGLIDGLLNQRCGQGLTLGLHLNEHQNYLEWIGPRP